MRFRYDAARICGTYGVSQNYLSAMEHGRFVIGAEIILRISREFGKSMEWLLTGED